MNQPHCIIKATDVEIVRLEDGSNAIMLHIHSDVNIQATPIAATVFRGLATPEDQVRMLVPLAKAQDLVQQLSVAIAKVDPKT